MMRRWCAYVLVLWAGGLAACSQTVPVVADASPARGPGTVPAAAEGTVSDGDESVRRILDELGLTYAVDPDGDYELIFRFSSGRQQRVYVWSETGGFEGFPVREIRSYAFAVADAREDVLPDLLADTLKRELGGWAIDGPYAVFVTRISADSGSDAFHVAVEYAAFVADEMEREVYGGIRDGF